MNETLSLASLAAQRVSLSAAGQDLVVRGPRDAVTEELLGKIRERKRDLLEELRGSSDHRESEAAEATRRLAEDGWTVVRSETLGGELVVWTKNETVKIPERLGNLVRYTRAELAALEGATEQQLRDTHERKRRFLAAELQS